MRSLLFFFAFIPFLLNAQAFHIDDTLVTLVKTTDHSPIHWYAEIHNDVGVDTTLRWKTRFINVPAIWQINFDDQDNYYAIVEDGDSADFTLHAGLSFPQKLIIGAIVNDTPASCRIEFDIYDPNSPSDVTTVIYDFRVSAPVSIEEFDLSDHVLVKASEIQLNGLEGYFVQLADMQGKVVAKEHITGQLSLDTSSLLSGVYLLTATKGNNSFALKVFR